MKKAIIIIVCLLVGVFLASIVGFMTNGFDKNQDNWGITQLNEDNYFKVDDYVIKDQNSGDGYSIDVSDKGEIKVTGKNESAAAVTVEIQSITLPLDNAEGRTIYADFGDNTFTLSAEDTFKVYLSIAKDAEVNKTFKPVLVKGETAGDFYVINNND